MIQNHSDFFPSRAGSNDCSFFPSTFQMGDKEVEPLLVKDVNDTKKANGVHLSSKESLA
jgi:hypothetical protein